MSQSTESRHIYDAAVIGCGYVSVGAAGAIGNAVILEEESTCDTHVYLPLSSFRHHPYTPTTAEGRRLAAIFERLGLFRDGMQNTNAMEIALCSYLATGGPRVLLKCRVVDTERDGEVYRLAVQTNEGITHLYARSVIHTERRGGTPRFTVLLEIGDIGAVRAPLLAAFPGATLEPAFYPGRYALHIPAAGYDENGVKCYAYETLRAKGLALRILTMAPTFSYEDTENPLSDDFYRSPIEALEAGIAYAKEGMR